MPRLPLPSSLRPPEGPGPLALGPMDAREQASSEETRPLAGEMGAANVGGVDEIPQLSLLQS